MKNTILSILWMVLISGCNSINFTYLPYQKIGNKTHTDTIHLYKLTEQPPKKDYIIIGGIISDTLMISDIHYKSLEEIQYHTLDGKPIEYQELVLKAQKKVLVKNGDAIIQWHFYLTSNFDDSIVCSLPNGIPSPYGILKGDVVVYNN